MKLQNCPTGFVFPDDENDSQVQWIGNTGCASSCIGGDVNHFLYFKSYSFYCYLRSYMDAI